MKASKLTIEAADKGSDVQKVHAKFLHNTLEREVEVMIIENFMASIVEIGYT